MGGLSRWVNEKEIRTLGKNEEFVTVVKKMEVRERYRQQNRTGR